MNFNDLAFTMYMQEKEGHTTTREGRINKMRKLLEQGYGVEQAASLSSILLNSLTESELKTLGLRVK